jgi:L-threonylcarbamoyladenylate synthase
MTALVDISIAIQWLKAGKLVAFPTETVYGLGADALNQSAVERIYKLKGRPANHPVIVHLGRPKTHSAEGFRALLDPWVDAVPNAAITLCIEFWPGPMTLVLRRSRQVPDWVTGGLETVALRVPRHPLALALLTEWAERETGMAGIAAPSANRFSEVSPTSASHVERDFHGKLIPLAEAGQLAVSTGVDGLILDGGLSAIGIESSIIDLATGSPRVLRPGAITLEQVESALCGHAQTPTAECSGDSVTAIPIVPGSLPKHYSPRAKIILHEPDTFVDVLMELCTGRIPLSEIGLLLPADEPADLAVPQGLTVIAIGANLDSQAARLYAALRSADELGLRILHAVLPPDGGIGTALRDRLRRAAGVASPSEH